MSTLFPNAKPRTSAPFRNDIVGSFLRPPALKAATQSLREGKISQDEYQKVLNHELANLINKEKQHGLHAVTDGELPRSWWHLDFLAGLEGAELMTLGEFPVSFTGAKPRSETVKITGKIDFSNNHPFVNQYKNLKKLAGNFPTKFTIPSPSLVYQVCYLFIANPPIERYKNNEDLLFDDIANAYIKAAQTFYDLGLRYLQLDDTTWGHFASEKDVAEYKARGYDIDYIQRKYIETVNKIIAAKPKDLTITMHICRGNFRSTWFSEGSYEAVAENLFSNCNVDGFFLEYDDERSGDFSPLRFIKDQQVVLGLITSKTGELENKDAVIARIKAASEYVDINQLCLSPQCGFASTEEGNVLSEAQQWAKLDLIKDIADTVWGA